MLQRREREKNSLMVQTQVELAESQKKINPKTETQTQMQQVDMEKVVAVTSQSEEKILPKTKTQSQMQADMQMVVLLAQSEVKILPETMDAMGESNKAKKINPKAQHQGMVINLAGVQQEMVMVWASAVDEEEKKTKNPVKQKKIQVSTRRKK